MLKTIKISVYVDINEFLIKIDHFAPNYFVKQKGSHQDRPFYLACNMLVYFIKSLLLQKGPNLHRPFYTPFGDICDLQKAYNV